MGNDAFKQMRQKHGAVTGTQVRATQNDACAHHDAFQSVRSSGQTVEFDIPVAIQIKSKCAHVPSGIGPYLKVMVR